MRAQQPVFERHFAERKRFLDLMGFKWLPPLFEGDDATSDEARDQRPPPCLRLNDDELFPLGKKKRAKKAPKGPKQPLPLPTAGDIDVDYSKYTVKVLKDLLRDRGLPVSGRRKADYVERLAADDIRLQQEAPAVAEEEDEDDLL